MSIESQTTLPIHFYRIRIRVANEAVAPRQVQIRSREWHIYYKSGEIERVAGPALVGQYPIIRAGDDGVFSYLSCTQDHDGDQVVAMEGEFTCVPGTFVSPTGDSFQIKVGRFEMQHQQANPFKES